MRWDFAGLERMPEQSVTTGVGGQHGYANDIVCKCRFARAPRTMRVRGGGAWW